MNPVYPEFLRIGSFVISSFGVMLVVAFLAAYAQLAWGMKRTGVGTSEDASAIVFSAGLFGILGAKIYFAILYGDWSLLLSRYGLVWYGGFLAGVLAVLLTIRRRRLSYWGVLDAAGPALALGYGLGRIGCFLVGDDYGLPTERPWGIAFPNGLPPTTGYYLRREFGLDLPAEIGDDTVLAVHPTQLYEAGLALLIWLGSRFALRSGSRVPGRVGLGTLVLLGVERLVVEFWRAKDDRLLGDLTIAQLISAGVIAVSVGFLLARRTAGTAAPRNSLPR